MVNAAKNVLIMLKNLEQIHLKVLQKGVIQETAETTGDLVGNEIANEIRKISKTSQQNNSETVTNEHNKEITKERYISPEERQKIIDDLN